MIIKVKMSTQQVSMWTMEGKILQMAEYLTIWLDLHVYTYAHNARSNNQLCTENTKITAFWDIMPCTVACDMMMSKMYCPYLPDTEAMWKEYYICWKTSNTLGPWKNQEGPVTLRSGWLKASCLGASGWVGVNDDFIREKTPTWR